MKTFKEWEMINISFDGDERIVCPECREHKQTPATAYSDCVNVYTVDKVLRQCCCFAKQHKQER